MKKKANTFKIGIYALATTPDSDGERSPGGYFIEMTPDQINDPAYVSGELEKWRGEVAEQLDIPIEEVVLITPEEEAALVEAHKNAARDKARARSRALGKMLGMSDEDMDEADKLLGFTTPFVETTNS